MKKPVPALLALVTCALALAFATTASAQLYDHLECFKMKDPHKFTALADLTPFQVPPFSAAFDCKIKVKGREFCIPVEKNLIPGSGNAPSAPVVGQQLQNDFICYVAKCPKPPTPYPPVLVSDQFGSRTLNKFVTKRLCTPAIKGSPTTTTTTTTSTTTTTMQNPCALDAAGICGGVCPNPADTCLADPLTGVCGCQPQSAQCAFDSVTLLCGGLCPNPMDSCIPDPAGTANCLCAPACQFASLPACGGTCPGAQICTKDPTTTFCLCCGTLGVSCVTTADCCGGFSCVAGTCQ